MDAHRLSRRDLLMRGSTALAGLALLHSPLLSQAFPSRPGEEVIPWVDQPPPHPRPQVASNLLQWEELNTWITPNAKFFRIAHYQGPLGPALMEKQWKLEITGQVKRPLALTLSQLKARPRQEVIFTLECSGNHGSPFFIGGIGTATWAGTPLAPLLQEAGVSDEGIEVVFVGSDAGDEEVRKIKMPQNFARSMSVADAMSPNNLLCYEMNGGLLPQPHGFPLRLIAPGWYGIANVKWLKRIEVPGHALHRPFHGARLRDHSGRAAGWGSVWMETSVGRALLKSAPAKVTRKNGQYRIIGAAWGAPIQRVEVRVDSGPWVLATIDRGEEAEFAWKIWSLEWQNPSPGEHTIASRAIDTMGHIQPAMDDPWIAKKRTHWESNGQVTRRIRLT